MHSRMPDDATAASQITTQLSLEKLYDHCVQIQSQEYSLAISAAGPITVSSTHADKWIVHLLPCLLQRSSPCHLNMT